MANFSAVFLVGGHPSVNISNATTNCRSTLVPIVGKEIEKLVADRSYFSKTITPRSMYPETNEEIVSFGLSPTLVTSAAVAIRWSIPS